ncbi:hypothetical protein M758_4G085600, partial [Ceratodon purpureus]
AKFVVVPPRAFSRICLVVVRGSRRNCERGPLFHHERFDLSPIPECVEVCETPGGFCADHTREFKFKAVVRGFKDSVFFVSSEVKPEVDSATKNARGCVSHVLVLSKMHSDNCGAFEELVRTCCGHRVCIVVDTRTKRSWTPPLGGDV